MNGNEKGDLSKQNNLPGINNSNTEEYNISGSTRTKPSADVAWMNDVSNTKITEHIHNFNTAKASPGKGSSRGTLQNETPGAGL